MGLFSVGILDERRSGSDGEEGGAGGGERKIEAKVAEETAGQRVG